MKVIFNRLRTVVWGASIVVIGSCGTPAESSPDQPSRRMLVANLASNVMLTNYESARNMAGALETALGAYESSPNETTLLAARDAWKAAMVAWQKTEAHVLGPAGMNLSMPGGMDLRDEIYAWPLINRCRIDQTTAGTSYANAASLAALPINVRGLSAIEYLLFPPSAGNACSETTDINANGSWAALGDEEVGRRRATYAKNAATIAREKLDVLVDAWKAEGGYLSALSTAGAGSALYPTAQAALNAVSDGLLVLEYAVKDMKIGEPAGIALGCAQETCPDRLEANLAHLSKELVLANIESFRELFTGSTTPSGYGFDDLLAEVGAAELADRILADLDAVEAAVEAISGSLEEALVATNTEGRAAVQVAYDAIKLVTDVLKTEFLTVLDLQLPSRLDGDND